MSKARIEAFSDAVIAVAITLLALNLHVPDPAGSSSLARGLAEQWPNYAAFVVSFTTIGIIWINHHAMLRRIVIVDHTSLLLNLLLLLTICVLPFTTALMAEYLNANEGQKLAAAVYSASFLFMSLAFFAIAAAPAALEGSSAARAFDTRSTAEGATAQRLWLGAIRPRYARGARHALPHARDLRGSSRLLRPAGHDDRRSVRLGPERRRPGAGFTQEKQWSDVWAPLLADFARSASRRLSCQSG